MFKQSIFALSMCIFLMAGSAWAQALPDTGQTKCYDTAGVEITCPQPGEAFYGQDAEYVKTRSYTDLGSGIIRDNVTGLEWVQDGNLMATRNPSFDNDGTAGDGRVTWQHALDYVALLNAGGYLGHSDWRLPTVKELSLLVDRSRFIPAPTIDPVFSAVASSYWSSTAGVEDTSTAARVAFGTGQVYGDRKTSCYYVRAVRGTPLPANNFINNNDGTITDTSTGLMWQQATAAGTYTWQQALAYCEDLDLAGYTDWRLPDSNELQSIVDYRRFDPAMNPVFSAVAGYYWSSTTYAYSTFNAWPVDFYYGSVLSYSKSNKVNVRAVRSGQYVLLGDLGDLCIEDYHCDEGEVCVEGECQSEVEDNPPALGDGPHIAAGWWPLLSDSQASPTYLRQNYYLLWTFSDDFASCSGECTHSAEYSVAGSGTWTALSVSSDAGEGYAWVELPIAGLQNATTYAFRFAVTDCASQTTQSEEYYFRAATGIDAPPSITAGPFLAAGAWPLLPASEARAVVLDQNSYVLWTFEDDYVLCGGLCAHRARYRRVGESDWTWVVPQTDPEGVWYAYTQLPVESLEAGTYQFQFDVIDCAGQIRYPGNYYYFKVE